MPAEPQVLTPEQEEAAYEAEFNKLVAAKESGEDEPAQEPKPAEEPAAEPEQKPEGESAPDKPEDKPEPDPDAELLAGVPEERREALAARLKAAADAEARARKLENDNRSMAGRMSVYQRKYEEATGKRPVAAEPAAKPATEAQVAEWEQFTQDYPDIAKAIEARYAAQQPAGSAETIQGLVEYVESEKRSRFLQDAWEALEDVHPGWRDLGKTREFQEWKASSPTYEKLASSDDIADAVALFDLYEGHRLRSGSPTTPSAQQAAEAAKLAARRGAQAEGARAPTNRAQAPNHNVDLNDDDQAFAFYAKQSNKRLKDRYS